MLKSAATFLVALKAVTLILSVPTILASPVRSEINQGTINPNIFLGAPITSIQQYFTPHKVTLTKTIGGNNDQTVALGHGKYGDLPAFIKCVAPLPTGKPASDRQKEIDREREAFSILQEADARPGSNNLVGYTNVSRAYTHFAYGNNYCFVYSYDGNIDLAEYLRSIWPNNIPAISSGNILLVRSLISDILSGLIYLHNAHLVHHDIKTHNVVISFPYPNTPQRPKATIIDFDLSERIQYNGNSVVPASNLVGTMSYIAPEVFAHHLADPTKKDVWAAGITLYKLLTKRYLISGNDDRALAINIANTFSHELPEQLFAFTGPQFQQAEVSSLINALKAMLETHPTNRPSARECLAILNGANPPPRTQPIMPSLTPSQQATIPGGSMPVEFVESSSGRPTSVFSNKVWIHP
ncbi:kinase-like domain-containing protein [Syncephalis plumigaleata]|nr:kinase-like domain-containing protein [Syncephalis plumigaleata]